VRITLAVTSLGFHMALFRVLIVRSFG